MTDQKLNTETVTNIYKNAHIALQSISDVLPECSSQRMKDELVEEHDGYERFIGNLSKYMRENGYEPKDINIMKKAMLYTSVKMNTLTDDSCSHIADMMVKGTVMGITELEQIITRSENKVDKEIIDFAKELLNLEEEYEARLKQLL